MDSRIREALEISRDYIIDAINIRISTYGEAFRPHQLDEMRNDLSLVESEIALLTAEHEHQNRPLAEVFEDIRREYGADFDKMFLCDESEPCEDAYVVARRIDDRMHCIEGTPGFERLVQVRSILDVDEVANEIESYATQVSDKRVEELRAQVEMLRKALRMYADDSFYFPRGIVLECQKKGVRLAPCYSEFGKRAKEAIAATEQNP